MRNSYSVVICGLAVWAVGIHAAIADPPDTAAPLRPLVMVELHEGGNLTGVLDGFDDGQYWLMVNGKRMRFFEKDAKSIEFRNRKEVEETDPALADLIRRFLRVNDEGRAAHDADITLRTKLAKHGTVIIKPLLAAYAKHEGDYQQTGLALKELGPEAFPLLVEEFRQESQGKYGHPVWYALRESGVQHAGYVQTLLDDPDPRVRRLAMDTFYSWGITSGVALPNSLAPALVKILDDPDEDVRLQAPLILQRIGLRSDVVLPALLKTMTDDRYASVRSNSVIGLGSLARDLKEDDADLKTIVTALSTALTEDPSENIRSYAANYLGYLGPNAAAAIPALKRATDDKKEYVRKSAEEALEKVEGTKPLERDPFGGKKR